MTENLENRAMPIGEKPYYKLKITDFIPVYGLAKYCPRIKKDLDIENINRAAIRTAGLVVYNSLFNIIIYSGAAVLIN